MSWSVDTAFVNQYRGDLELKFQQEGSRLRRTVDEVTQNSEFQYFDRIGTVTANAMTVRHGDTPIDDIDHTRRRLQVTGYNNNLLFDTQDQLRMVIDPRSGYARSQALALGRLMDSTIIAAATGTAFTGKTGATSTAYDTTYQIAIDYTEGGAPAVSSNLTIGKLRRARYLLDSNEAVMDGEPIYAVVSASQVQSLLRTTEVTSADYNAVKALVNGEVNTFMGFTFVRTQLLGLSSTTRTCLVYPKSGIRLGVSESLTVHVDQRADKNYSWQVYSQSTFGAVRMWEEKVISILCNESV